MQTFVKALRPAQMKADSYKADRFLDGKWFFFGSSFVGVGLSFFGATFKKMDLTTIPTKQLQLGRTCNHGRYCWF